MPDEFKAVTLFAALCALIAVVVAWPSNQGPPTKVAYSQTIYVQNDTQFLTNKEVSDALPAIQAASDQDFAKYWHTTARLVFTGKSAPPQGSKFIILIDRGAYKNALAFHRIRDGEDGSVIYVGVCKLYNYSWTVAFTHELWEQLADPGLTRTQQGTDGRIWANEVADPVESDTDGYYRKGRNGVKVLISDFITDKWFGAAVNGPYDFLGHIQKPLEIRPGGYAQWWDGYSWHIIENWRNARDRAWSRER